MKTIASILVLNTVAVLSMDIVVKGTLYSVENCSFFETEHANAFKKILLSNGGVVIKLCYKTGQLPIKNCPFNL